MQQRQPNPTSLKYQNVNARALRPTTLTSVDFDISRHSESQGSGRARAHLIHSNHGRHKILSLVPHQGIADHPLPLRSSNSRPGAFPPPIPHFITPRRRTVRQCRKVQAQRSANHSQQEEEEVLHKLRNSRSARCSTVQPGGCHAVRKSRRMLQSKSILILSS
jgi:hypothetical protein